MKLQEVANLIALLLLGREFDHWFLTRTYRVICTFGARSKSKYTHIMQMVQIGGEKSLSSV